MSASLKSLGRRSLLMSPSLGIKSIQTLETETI